MNFNQINFQKYKDNIRTMDIMKYQKKALHLK